MSCIIWNKRQIRLVSIWNDLCIDVSSFTAGASILGATTRRVFQVLARKQIGSLYIGMDDRTKRKRDRSTLSVRLVTRRVALRRFDLSSADRIACAPSLMSDRDHSVVHFSLAFRRGSFLIVRRDFSCIVINRSAEVSCTETRWLRG